MKEPVFRPYRVPAEETVGEYEEKKSRFIAHLAPCKEEKDALAYVEAMRKKYYDARHNCTAMVLGANSELTRCSDDGEPSGTAGKPMLEVLLGAGLTNVCAVVTRYFGGTLLGTGGLVRAYQSALKDALKDAKILTVDYCADLAVTAAYPDVDRMNRYFGEQEIRILDTAYAENVRFNLRIREEEREKVQKSLTELTNGKAVIEILKKGYEAV